MDLFEFACFLGGGNGDGCVGRDQQVITIPLYTAEKEIKKTEKMASAFTAQ